MHIILYITLERLEYITSYNMTLYIFSFTSIYIYMAVVIMKCFFLLLQIATSIDFDVIQLSSERLTQVFHVGY